MASFDDLAEIPVGAVLDVRPFHNGQPQEWTPAVVICKAGAPGDPQGERPVLWLYEQADGRLINGQTVQPLYRDSEYDVRDGQEAGDVLTSAHAAIIRLAAEGNEAANARVFAREFLRYLQARGLVAL